MMLAGRNVSNFDKKSVKLISPRLFPLVPEGTDDEALSLLSPSLLALHDEGKGLEDALSLAKAMKYFDEQGHQEWLNFVIEASGVSDAVSKIRDVSRAEDGRRMDEGFRNDSRRMDEGFRNEKGQPLYFTKENITEMFGNSEGSKIELLEKLQKSLSSNQTKRQHRCVVYCDICFNSCWVMSLFRVVEDPQRETCSGTRTLEQT
ncbi:hypothetical protein COOONC_15888 [Cooperia oncophora]